MPRSLNAARVSGHHPIRVISAAPASRRLEIKEQVADWRSRRVQGRARPKRPRAVHNRQKVCLPEAQVRHEGADHGRRETHGGGFALRAMPGQGRTG
jgi:hypothetical protein